MLGCQHLTNAGLRSMSGLSSLRSLHIEDCSSGGRFNDAGLAHLGQLARFTEVKATYEAL